MAGGSDEEDEFPRHVETGQRALEGMTGWMDDMTRVFNTGVDAIQLEEPPVLATSWLAAQPLLQQAWTGHEVEGSSPIPGSDAHANAHEHPYTGGEIISSVDTDMRTSSFDRPAKFAAPDNERARHDVDPILAEGGPLISSTQDQAPEGGQYGVEESNGTPSVHGHVHRLQQGRGRQVTPPMQVEHLLEVIRTAIWNVCWQVSPAIVDRAINILLEALHQLHAVRQQRVGIQTEHPTASPVMIIAGYVSSSSTANDGRAPPPGQSRLSSGAVACGSTAPTTGSCSCRYESDCGKRFNGSESTAEIKRHLRAFHGVETRSQPADKTAKCLWAGCSTDIRAGGLAKHLRDVHLRVGARRCSYCGRMVSREDAMKRHEKRCKALRSALASEGTKNWGYGAPSGN